MIESGNDAFSNVGSPDKNGSQTEIENPGGAQLTESEKDDLLRLYELFWQEQIQTEFAGFKGNDLFSAAELISDQFARKITGQKASLTLAENSLKPWQLEQEEREVLRIRNAESQEYLKVGLAQFIANSFSFLPLKKQKEVLAKLSEKHLLGEIFIDTYKLLPPVDRMALVVIFEKFNYSEHSGVCGREDWTVEHNYFKRDNRKTQAFDPKTISQKSPALIRQIALRFLKLANRYKREAQNIAPGVDFTVLDVDHESAPQYIADFAAYLSTHPNQEIVQIGNRLSKSILETQDAIKSAIIKAPKGFLSDFHPRAESPWGDKMPPSIPETSMQVIARGLEPAELTVPYIPEIPESIKKIDGKSSDFLEKSSEVIEALKQSDVALAIDIFLEGLLAGDINDIHTMSIAKILAKDCVCNSRGPQYKKALMDSLHGSVQERNEGKALAIIDLLDYIGAVLSNIGAIDYYELGMQGLPKEFRKVWLTSDILNVYRIGHGIQEDTSLPLIIQMAARRSFSANEDFDYASQCFEFTEKKMRDGSFTVIDGKVHRSNDGKDEIVKKEMLLINPESCSDQDFLWNTQLAIRLMRYDLRHELEKLFSPLPEAEKNAQTNHAYWHDYLGDEGDIFGKKSFTEKTSFKLGRLSYRELFFFAKFIANKTRPEMEPIIQFIKQYGVKGLRVFLATEQDSEMGSSILALGSQLPIKTAEKLFKKYCDIITASEQVAEYCEENIARNKKDTAPRLAIQNQLLQRGKKLLQTAATDLKRATTKEDRRFALATLRGELDHMRADILLFAATFKVAADHGSIRLEDVRSTELVTEQSNKIKDFEKKDMLRIYEENRPGYSPELLKETMREFESALATSGKKFYILKNNGVIVAFIRFDELANQDLYAGSLNVRPEARGSAIGSAMLIETLSKEGAMRDIKAVAYSRNPMLKHYIEDFGFAIVREIPDYHGTGELFYELKRPAGWKKETIAKKAA